MNRNRSFIKENNSITLILFTFILFLFSLTRVYRNSIDYSSSSVGGIWNIIVLLFCICSILCFIFAANKVKGDKTIGLIIVYGLISFANNILRVEFTITSVYNTLMILSFPLTLYFFYFLFSKYSSKKFATVFFILYYVLLTLVLATNLMRLSGHLTYIMVSNVYYLLCLFPLALSVAKKKTLLVLLTFIPIITSEKRVALLSFVISLAVYILVKSILQRDLKKVFIYIIIGATVFVVFTLLLSFFERRFNVAIMSRLLNLSNDRGSGRADMYQAIYRAFNDSPVFNKLFGHGIDTSKNILIVHDDVHDDFLQILYEYGLISFLAFLAFYLSFAFKSLRSILTRSNNAPYLCTAFVISVFLSLFSVFITDYTYSICMAFSLGFLFASPNYLTMKGATSANR